MAINRPAPDAQDQDASAVGNDAVDGSPGDEGTPDSAQAGPVGSYSIVVLPDTQFYSSAWPEIFSAQTRWIVENRQAQEIAFVLHTGDVVDTDDSEQWTQAMRSLQILDDGAIPYAITAGNHDYFNLADRMGLINTFLPPTRFADRPWFGGTFEAGHLENSFSIMPAGKQKWLVLALEFGPRDEVLAWADTVLKLFRETPAIVITHAYLYRDGTRYDDGLAVHQQFNPHDYVMMGQPGTTVNDGEEIWRKLISVNPNVKLIFSGHDVSGVGLPPGTASRLSSTRPDGSVVHQILANYQTCLGSPCENYAGAVVHGGNGFLRLLRFSPIDSTISVTTYSPYLGESLHDPTNEFVLQMN